MPEMQNLSGEIMKRTLPVYYTPSADNCEQTQGELTFTTLSVDDHAALEGQEERIHDALADAAEEFRKCMDEIPTPLTDEILDEK